MIIAIVDDEPMMLKSMKRILNEKYPEVKIACCCRTAREFLDILKETDIDVVITDVCMPGLNGIELCRIIRENKYDIEIIMISGHSDFEYVKEAMSYGVKRYILKPINQAKINDLVKYLKLVENEKNNVKKLRRRIGSMEITNQLNDLLWGGAVDEIRQTIFPSDIIHINSDVVKSYITYIINVLSFFVKDNELPCFENEDLFAIVMSKQSYEEMVDYIVERCADIVLCIQSANEITTEINNKATEIRRYIERNHTNPDLGLDMLSVEFDLSTRHISRIFAKQYGESISKYILSLRIENAKKLLRKTNIPTDDIVAMIGYTSSRYFKQCFKEQMGCTMNEYRNVGDNDEDMDSKTTEQY